MIEQRLTQRIEASAEKRIQFSTEIVATDGGQEQRNSRWTYPLIEYDIHIPTQARNSADYLATRNLFMAAKGAWDSWLFHDHDDCQAVDEAFGVGDGEETVYQLRKNYTVGATNQRRQITRPVSPITVKIDGVTQGSGFSVDYDTGRVTFDVAPDDGDVLTWTGAFDVPVRFMEDALVLVGVGNKGEISFSIREVRE